MSAPRSRPVSTAAARETRRRLLEAARALFAEQGVDATRINEITERADVGFGSFYNHFTGKDAVVEAVLQETTEQHGAAVDRLTADLDDPAEVVAVAHRHFVRLAIAEPAWGWLMIRLDASHRVMDTALAGRARRNLRSGMDAGRFAIADLDLILNVTGGALLGAIRAVVEGHGDAARADVHHAEAVLRMLGVPTAEAAAVAARPLPVPGVTAQVSRRALLRGAAGAGLAAAVGARPAAAQTPTVSTGRTKLVVLGSHGGQQITRLTGADVRAGTSFVVAVDGRPTVIDCGVGSLHRLVEAGYDANQVERVLVTHCHADHVADLGNFALLGWSSGRNGAEADRRMDIYGPTGLHAYRDGLRHACARSIADQEGPLGQQPTFRRFARWHERKPPAQPTAIVRKGPVKISTIRVAHGSMPAVGYRLRTPDLDIAFSGDRGAKGDRFLRLARGADVLVHEVIDRRLVVTTLKAQGTAPSFIDHLVDDHADVADVGRFATRAGVGTLVLSHLIPGSPGLSDAAWTAMVRPHFAGRIVVARDLLVV